ncbi:MAG TPA: sulfatase-like hydrolase/transferase [Thermoanaerobaculia bacterium]|jgi:phosphoglycerol transferase MdoB-like AlkP superfamily enzyme|nr:sulfatase-like hydrolase/transferase [Thermoanaerobaculia bacterium]
MRRSPGFVPVTFASAIALFTLLRFVFFLVFRPPLLDRADVLRAFYLGLKFDARLAALLVIPMLLMRRRAMLIAYVVIALAFVLTLYAADFGTYAYIHQRLNAGVFEFLRNPIISWHMIWESYHVVWFALGIVIALVLVVAGFSTGRFRNRPPHIAFILLLIACLYGKLSRYPLRWSDAYFSRDPFIGELALNPAQFLFETMREHPATFDVARVHQLYPLMARYVGVIPHDLSLSRAPSLHPRVSGEPNIVLIQLESFAAFKTAVFGNTLNASPNFDAIARQGVLFTQHYSPSEKTARALFAVLFGIPDVSAWQASAHNPLTVHQCSIANAFADYEKFYFLGGSANWSNIRAMLEHNIDRLHMIEEGSYKAPVVDVWGISDEDLFIAANDTLRHQAKPFFAIIQTAGNHRPYTIPKQTHGFVLRRDFVPGRGFESLEELNSFRYLDHALGLFFALARRERYFANTVFVIYGDHGTRTGADPTWLKLGDLSPAVYHVPFVIYALGVAPQRIDVPSSHIDILPTLTSFCGRPYVDTGLGVDLLDPGRAHDSAAFIFTTFRDPPDLAVMQHARWSYDTPLAQAFYEWSRWLLYHNDQCEADGPRAGSG